MEVNFGRCWGSNLEAIAGVDAALDANRESGRHGIVGIVAHMRCDTVAADGEGQVAEPEVEGHLVGVIASLQG